MVISVQIGTQACVGPPLGFIGLEQDYSAAVHGRMKQ